MSQDRARMAGLTGGSLLGCCSSWYRMGVGGFAFWATETSSLMCLIRHNVLIGRIVPGIHSAPPVSESRVFCHESTARILNHVKRQSIKFSVSNFLKLFDENAP